MKIALFYPGVNFTPWSMGLGLANALRGAGHSVLIGKLPVGEDHISESGLEELKATLPTLEALGEVDLVLVSGPELIVPWLEGMYGRYEWKHSVKARKVAWYHSPFFNEQVTINFDHLEYWAEEHFFPAFQDAELFDQEGLAKGRAHWLPFGVDTRMFDAGLSVDRRIALAHIGGIGDRAFQYMGALNQHEHPAVKVGKVDFQNVDGFMESETAAQTSVDLRKIRVFFNFPGPQFLEAKLLEAMACGAMVLTPMLTASRGTSKNHSMFDNGTHWLSYRASASALGHVAKMLREWSSDEKAEEREKIAATGLAAVRANHSLEKRLEEMFSKVGLKELVQ